MKTTTVWTNTCSSKKNKKDLKITSMTIALLPLPVTPSRYWSLRKTVLEDFLMSKLNPTKKYCSLNPFHDNYTP